MKVFTISPKAKERHRMLPKIAAWAFWIGAWQLAAWQVNQRLFLVSPLDTFRTLLLLLGQPIFWGSMWHSTLRILGGFLGGMAFGVLLGMLAAYFAWVRLLLSPVTWVIKTIPVASFVILVIICMGTERLASVISFLMAWPIVYANTLEGFLNADQGLLEMAQVFRISWPRRIFYLHLPQATPFILSAASVALGLCWKAGVAAEVIGISSGSLGGRLYEAKIYLNTSELFAVTAMVILLSAVCERMFVWCFGWVLEKLKKGALL